MNDDVPQETTPLLRVLTPPPDVQKLTLVSKTFGIFLIFAALFISGIIPYILYRNILHQNFYLAPLDGYPTPFEIAEQLGCPHTPNTTLDRLSKKSRVMFKVPLRTKGRNIVDASGERVKLISINWYGASDEQFVVGGLDFRHRREIAKTIRDMGFNSVRLPYSDELVIRNPLVPEKFFSKNTDLFHETEDEPDPGSKKGYKAAERSLPALKIFEATVQALTDEGLAVIINNHITQARWCCDANLCDATWSNDYLGKVCRIQQTEEQWIQNLETVMRPHVNNPLVIGVDLRNENRSPLGKMLWNTWAPAAEKAANRLHLLQPNWLMVIEGVASSNFLQPVRDRPIKLNVPDRVVYSSHIYGWSGWGSIFNGPYWSRDYASFAYDMYENWGFLLEENIAPVWVGEFGAPDKPNTGDLNYWTNLIKIMEEVDPDWAYWAINPRKPHGNEEESYSLLHDDWKTPRCDYRMFDMVRLGLRPYRNVTDGSAPLGGEV